MRAYYDDINVIQVITKLKKEIKKIEFENLPLDWEKTGEGYKVTFAGGPLPLGKNYDIYLDGKRVLVEPRGIVKTQWFDETYSALGARLGSYVENDITYFAVWSPVATQMFLEINTELFEMNRDDKGVYRYSIDRNLHNQPYWYGVVINNETHQITDPYAQASLPNRWGSVVVDFNQLDLEIASLEKVEDPIVLEVSVRDFSMDPNVPFKHRGKFLGLLETHGEYGMKHILDLGITHLQIMPIIDFETVNEFQPSVKYNWGYDPMQMMAIEGSYSSNLDNPVQVIKDFAEVMDAYHKENIGVNMDVVFNHVYEQGEHPLQLLVPYYYFRYDNNYNLSNGSFCGNEFASEMPMARKIVIETMEYYVRTFKVDGYRFDLMGLMDITTINEALERCRAINPNVMFYGEGWTMPTVLPYNEQASMAHQELMPDVGHFNDFFRDKIGGKLNEGDLGILEDRWGSLDILRTALSGSSNGQFPPVLFDTSTKSVNYVECHDNLTLADKVSISNRGPKEAEFLTAIVILSQGIPFLQIGQSFFRNKKMVANPYNAPDEVNRIEWSYLDKYRDMNESIKSYIKKRKEIYKIREGYSFEIVGTTLRYYYGMNKLSFNPSNLEINILEQ